MSNDGTDRGDAPWGGQVSVFESSPLQSPVRRRLQSQDLWVHELKAVLVGDNVRSDVTFPFHKRALQGPEAL
jgi:hypothetical protein